VSHILVPLEVRLQADNAKSRSSITNVSMGDDAVFFIVSTKDGVDINTIYGGKKSLQFIKHSLDADLLQSLYQPDQSVPENATILAPMSTNVFQDTVLHEGDVMIVLSSKEVVRINNLEAGNGSVLLVGQMPVQLIELVATNLGMVFTPTEYSLLQNRLHYLYTKILLIPCGMR